MAEQARPSLRDVFAPEIPPRTFPSRTWSLDVVRAAVNSRGGEILEEGPEGITAKVPSQTNTGAYDVFYWDKGGRCIRSQLFRILETSDNPDPAPREMCVSTYIYDPAGNLTRYVNFSNLPEGGKRTHVDVSYSHRGGLGFYFNRLTGSAGRYPLAS